MRKKGHFAKVCRQRTYNNRTAERLTADDSQQPNESTTSESEQSIHRIKEVRTLKEKNKHYNQNKRSEERVYHRHRITNNNNATGR